MSKLSPAEMAGEIRRLHDSMFSESLESAKQYKLQLELYVFNHALDFADALEENERLQAVVGSASYCKRDAEDRLALLRHDYEQLEAEVEGAQRVMQQFAHIYPDGFPGDWEPQPEHLASQVTFLCNHQRADFQQLLDVIKRLEKAEALLKSVQLLSHPIAKKAAAYFTEVNNAEEIFGQSLYAEGFKGGQDEETAESPEEEW
jgi:hypothetical protein